MLKHSSLMRSRPIVILLAVALFVIILNFFYTSSSVSQHRMNLQSSRNNFQDEGVAALRRALSNDAKRWGYDNRTSGVPQRMRNSSLMDTSSLLHRIAALEEALKKANIPKISNKIDNIESLLTKLVDSPSKEGKRIENGKMQQPDGKMLQDKRDFGTLKGKVDSLTSKLETGLDTLGSVEEKMNTLTQTIKHIVDDNHKMMADFNGVNEKMHSNSRQLSRLSKLFNSTSDRIVARLTRYKEATVDLIQVLVKDRGTNQKTVVNGNAPINMVKNSGSVLNGKEGDDMIKNNGRKDSTLKKNNGGDTMKNNYGRTDSLHKRNNSGSKPNQKVISNDSGKTKTNRGSSKTHTSNRKSNSNNGKQWGKGKQNGFIGDQNEKDAEDEIDLTDWWLKARERKKEVENEFEEEPGTPRPETCQNCFQVNFPIVRENRHVCGSDDVDLFMLIFTAPSSGDKREAVRKTWGSITNNNTGSVRHAFMLAMGDEYDNNMINAENQIYNDIVQFNFTDSYGNLTYKTLMSLKWVSAICPNAKHVLKTDDDMWVNVPGLLDLLPQDSSPVNHKSASQYYGYDNVHGKWYLNNAIGGFCAFDTEPNRDPNSKYYVSYKMYRNAEFPAFCSGTGYVLKIKTINAILAVAPSVPFFHLEDIYISICLRRIRGHFIPLPGFYNTRVEPDPCAYKDLNVITSHMLEPDELTWVWNTDCVRRKYDDDDNDDADTNSYVHKINMGKDPNGYVGQMRVPERRRYPRKTRYDSYNVR